MISYLKTPYETDVISEKLHPFVREWFFSKFKDFSPPQKYALIPIHERKHVLISSPTGSGKTLSAFLSILNELVLLAVNGKLEDKVYAVYVSPLKALGNDIRRNLLVPLDEITQIAKSHGKEIEIRVGIRTGDTTSYEKSKMLKKPVHILITTPESLGIMITTIKFREKLKTVQWVVIDEIHALAENKRGVHLSLTLERMQRLCPYYTRIALSATVSPLEDVARFLVGNEQGKERDCLIITVNFLKELDLKVLSPVPNLIRADYDVVSKKTYALIDKLIQEHKTTLIFTNTRSATERVVHYLREYYPKNYESIEEGIAAHHGSLAKEHRLAVEERLKEGKLKAVVCSTSLELGIDIGSIDLVILLGSPKSVARALQRIGRSGHKLHAKAKGRIIVQDRDDLVECSVLLKAALEGKIDKIHIPRNALDVLAQHILGICLEAPLTRLELYRLVTSSYSYATLSRDDFEQVLSYLSGEYVSLEKRYVYAKLWSDEDTGMLSKRGKLARLIYMTNIGTIPDETFITVKIGQEIIGSITEGFLEKLRKGDVFVLGGVSYEFRHAIGTTVQVRSASGRKPTVPSWYSQMLPLAYDLALEIQKFRLYMRQYFAAGKSKKEIIDFIDSYLYVDADGKRSIYEYFAEQYKFSLIPDKFNILIEHYNDGRNHYIFFHTLYGRRVNDVLSRCAAYVMSKLQQRDVEMMINDNGFAIRTTQKVQAVRALRLLRSDQLRSLAEKSLERSEILARRFRHCAGRSFMILRNYKGKRKSVGKQQMSSRLLLSSVKRIDPNFAILKEARREILEEVMDIEHAIEVVKSIEQKDVLVREVHNDLPSPFAFNLLLVGYTDIMKMQDRKEFLRKMHQMVLAKISLQKGHEDVLHQVSKDDVFTYDEYWEEKNEEKILDEQDEIDMLIRDLHKAARKYKIDPLIVRDLEEVVKRKGDLKKSYEGQKQYLFRKESVEFVEELLGKAIDFIWTDELVECLRKGFEDMKWLERS